MVEFCGKWKEIQSGTRGVAFLDPLRDYQHNNKYYARWFSRKNEASYLNKFEAT